MKCLRPRSQVRSLQLPQEETAGVETVEAAMAAGSAAADTGCVMPMSSEGALVRPWVPASVIWRAVSGIGDVQWA